MKIPFAASELSSQLGHRAKIHTLMYFDQKTHVLSRFVDIMCPINTGSELAFKVSVRWIIHVDNQQMTKTLKRQRPDHSKMGQIQEEIKSIKKMIANP